MRIEAFIIALYMAVLVLALAHRHPHNQQCSYQHGDCLP